MPAPLTLQSDGSPQDLREPAIAGDQPEPVPPVHDLHVAAVAAAYRALDDSFDALIAQASSEAECERLRALLLSAREAYWQATAARLGADNAVVREIYDDLNRATQQLKELLANLQRVDAIIEVATQTVRLAASLVTLAAL